MSDHSKDSRKAQEDVCNNTIKSRKDLWADRRKAKEEEYFKKQNEAAIKHLSEDKKESGVGKK